MLALGRAERAVFKSGRNIPKTEIRPVNELNAYEILRRRKVLFTKEAFEAVVANPESFQANGSGGVRPDGRSRVRVRGSGRKGTERWIFTTRSFDRW